MATAMRFTDMKFPDGFTWPTREELQERMREARRLAIEARHTAEDMAADATRAVRRRPLTAVAAAAGAGALVGIALGVGAAFAVKARPCGGD